MDTPTPPRRRFRRKTIVLSILALFLLPIAARAALYAYEGGSGSWRTADWSSTGSLPAAQAEPEARVLIMSGRTGGWKGVFSVHSWVVFKPRERQGMAALRRGRLGRSGADQLPRSRRPLVRQRAAGRARPARRGGSQGAFRRSRPRSKSYKYASAGDYRIWPGPNSNTFVATVLRAIPEAEAILPANAVGRDFRPCPMPA